MGDFTNAILSFPTVVFTVPLALVLVYWTAVFLGLLDFGEGDDGGLDGAMEALDGVEGALDGAVDGALDGAADGAFEAGDGDAIGSALDAADAGGEIDPDGCFDGPLAIFKAPLGCLANVLGAFGLVGVPMTLVLSLLALFGFGLCLGGTRLLKVLGLGLAAAGGVTILAGVGILAGSVFLGLALTSVAVRPMKPLFKIHRAKTRREWVGQVATVRSGSVDATFGQAEIDDGGAGLLLDVRCAEPNTLRRGDPALVYDYDAAREVYLVRPTHGELETNLDPKE